MAFVESRPLQSNTSTGTSLLYCRSCGNSIKYGQRCSGCGGSRGDLPASQNMASLGRKSKADPWASRYLPGIAPDDDGEQTQEAAEQRSEHKRDWMKSPYGRSSNATAFNLGVGMPSSISKDLKPSPTPSPLGSYASRPAVQRGTILSSSEDVLPPLSPNHQHMSHSPSQPVMEHPSGGGLSKVCGTVLDPESSRNKWACRDCQTIFARDSTIYVPPASAVKQEGNQVKDDFYCKGCYTNKYALGVCARQECSKPVLGSTKEYGAYVKTSNGSIYHGTCFRCQGCGAAQGDGTDIMLDLNGLPSCEGCFGSKPRRREVVLQRQSATAAPPRPSSGIGMSSSAFSPSLSSVKDDNQSTGFPFGRPDLGRKRSSYTSKRMGATIAELSQRFGSVSTTSPSSDRPKSPTRSPTIQPRAAHFSNSSGNMGYDLGAFKSSVSGSDLSSLNRSDSRVGGRYRSASPVKTGAQKMEESLSVKTSEAAHKMEERDEYKPLKETQSLATQDSEASPKSASRGRFPRPRNYDDAQQIASQANRPPPEDPSAQAAERNASPLQPEEPATIAKEAGERYDRGEVGGMTCAVCGGDPFHAPGASNDQEEALLVSLPSDSTNGQLIELHANCFKCAVCELVIDGSKSFVRLDGQVLSFAHPGCAPPVAFSRENTKSPSSRPAAHLDQSTKTRNLHPTLRSVPRPSNNLSSQREYVAVHSFIRRSTSIQRRDNPSPMTSPILSGGRQFKSTSGAAPPTRSTLNVHRPGGISNPAAGMFSSANSGAPSQRITSPSTTTRQYGGMHTCAGCSGRLTSLESVPGPSGSVWHKKCLICKAPAMSQGLGIRGGKEKYCGKQLDSFAKVRSSDGEVRCASCFREGN